MSHDLMVFDVAGLAGFPGDESSLPARIDDFVRHASSEPAREPTDKVREIVATLQGGVDDGTEGSPWAMWPPEIDGGGRRCTLSLRSDADLVTEIMFVADLAERVGVVLIDPQGQDPVLHVP